MPRQWERYCAKLVSIALGGAEYYEGHRFDFLRGDPTPRRPNGVALPVDAYYPTYDLVLEFREGQHYGDRFSFIDGRITATGDSRKVQREVYDRRRETVLPNHHVRLLIIYDYQLSGDETQDLAFVRRAVGELTAGNCLLFNDPNRKTTQDAES